MSGPGPAPRWRAVGTGAGLPGALLVPVTAAHASTAPRGWIGIDSYPFWLVGQEARRGNGPDLWAPGNGDRIATRHLLRIAPRKGPGAQSREASVARVRPVVQVYSWVATGILVALVSAFCTRAIVGARVGNVNRLQLGLLALAVAVASALRGPVGAVDAATPERG